VGYKAALTNPAVQKRFGYDQPLRGTLYAKMILPAGAKVPAAYGARPVYEADLVAVVGDAVHDLAMGRAAGVALAIGVLSGTSGRADLERHADLIVDSVNDLLERPELGG
jgi:2-keto-4-pentenoate hydratase